MPSRSSPPSHRSLVAFGVLMTFGASFGLTFYMALFNQQVQADLGLSEAELGMWFMLATLASAATLPWAGRLLDVLDLRVLVALAFAGLVSGCVLIAGAQTVLALAAAYYLLRISGQGLILQASQVALARYVEEGRRGLALGIAPLGVFAGRALLPAAAVAAAVWLGGSAEQGWRLSWLAAAGAATALMLLCLLALRGHGRRHSLYMETLRDDAPRSPAQGLHEDALRPSDADAQEGPGVVSLTRSQVVRDWRFWCLAACASCGHFVSTPIFFHQGWVAMHAGLTLAEWTAGLALMASASALASPLFGWVLDRVGARRCAAVPAVLYLAACLVLARWPVPGGVYACLAVLGVAQATGGVAFTPLWLELYGPRHLGAIKSVVAACSVTATAAAPALMGLAIAGGVGVPAFGLLCACYGVLALVLLPMGLGIRRAHI